MINFDEIISNLWMGGEFLPILDTTDFDVIVDCRMIEDLPLPMAEVASKTYLWLPFKDEPKLPPDYKIEMGEMVISVALSDNMRTLVHCTAGHNRSGLIVASYLIRWKDYKPDTAIKLIREARGQDALSNQTFLDYLHSL